MFATAWLLALPIAVAAAVFVGLRYMTSMPGETFAADAGPLDGAARLTRERVRRDVEHLASTIGERNMTRYDALQDAAAFIADAFTAAGYAPDRREFASGGRNAANIVAALPGTSRAQEIVLVGAHYDTVPGSPGANDNASGVAAVLELARLLAGAPGSRTLRFVAFANEEPPYFASPAMGSHVYARDAARRGENIVAMLSLETIGFFADEPGSQRYPFPLGLFYPNSGHFIAFVGNLRSRRLVREAVGLFRRHGRIASEGVAAPAAVPGIAWSDHWSFWQFGYPALMVTDTAPYRYPHYHSDLDTPGHLDYDRMALVVGGLAQVVAGLAR